MLDLIESLLNMTSEAVIKETLSTNTIFNQYFRTKLFVWWAVFIIVTTVRYFTTRHSLEWDFIGGFFAVATLAAIVLGYLDYYFYQKEAPKICLELINTAPLKEFSDIGFVHEYDGQEKLIGTINSFQVILSPAVNRERKKFLIILIPITLKDGLEKYFPRFDELFRFTINGELLMAMATVNDYDKIYDFGKLYKSIVATTELLLERDIPPLETIED